MQQDPFSDIKVAAIQMDAELGDVQANLNMCEKLVSEAATKGAKWIILPEFFTTGMAFDQQLINSALPPNGKATKFLLRLAKQHDAFIGGSFLCREEDGHVRNTFYLASPDGIVGHHNKDMPTMWENCFFIGGDDDGIIHTKNMTVGAVLCWEFMRSQTAERLQHKVDMIIGGSCWWSMPTWPPYFITEKLEAHNAQTAHNVVQAFTSYVGVPIIYSAHCGKVKSKMPWMPINYTGFYEGGAMIVNATGDIVGIRHRDEGPGVVVATITPGKRQVLKDPPKSYWLHKRGPILSFAWTYQRLHGKRWYRKHMQH